MVDRGLSFPEGGQIKRQRLIIMFVIGVVLAGVIGGWWVSQPDEAVHPEAGVRVARAAVGDKKGCATCHADPITKPCTDCHPQPSLPTVVTPDMDKNFPNHHDFVDSGWGFPVVPNCQNVECHGGTVGDARYAIRPVFDGTKATGHAYCWGQCHDGVKVYQPSCGGCHQ